MMIKSLLLNLTLYKSMTYGACFEIFGKYSVDPSCYLQRSVEMFLRNG